MEKIFMVRDQIDAKIIGRSFPQVTRADDALLDKENMKRVKEEQFLDIPASGYHITLQKSAKHTDHISSFMDTHTPVVSERLVQLLRRFRMPAFRQIPLTVYQGGAPLPSQHYSILHFADNDKFHINFPQSTFDYFTGGSFLDRSLLQFASYEDYRAKVARDSRVEMAVIKKVVMQPSLPHDLFYLGIFDSSSFFIREGLKVAMEQEGITGFRIEEVGYVTASPW